ncbi:type II toxin-antitoxin system YafO family toxin [Enterobacter hormaechei]|uniref:type II toxin-antitoxin system YafO family toxin n=1 Tax=Enterobacter hormaechei TaxID=158836 RepID=UPI0036BE0B69
MTYKTTGAPSDLLGRNAPFDFPPFAVDANARHIHVNLNFQLTWSAKQENYKRTSDHYLIYTEHMWDNGRFLLMGLITLAHERMPARDTRLLSYFSEVAENFHASCTALTGITQRGLLPRSTKPPRFRRKQGDRPGSLYRKLWSGTILVVLHNWLVT